MSRSYHNAFSQQQHHHTHQNSWFMSPNIVNSLFCSPGNNTSANCNNTFLNGSNINNHLSNLLNAPHHFVPNQLTSSQAHSNSSQPPLIGGNTFSSHYHGNHQNFSSQPYSSIFSMNNTYSNSGSGNRFIAGQNNHHYQSSSNYSRSLHSNRTSRANINFNSESSHSRRYQPGLNSNGSLLAFPGSVANNKSININPDSNLFNETSARSISSNASVFQNKDSKSLSNNNNYNYNSKYHDWGTKSNCETHGNISGSGSASDLQINSKTVNKNHHVKGMENIKLDNEGVHSNYVQFTGMLSKSSTIVVHNCESPQENKSKDLLFVSNSRESIEKTNNNHPKSNTNRPTSELRNNQMLPDVSAGYVNEHVKPNKNQIVNKNSTNSCENQKKNPVKFTLNADEDELVYYDDIVESGRYQTENIQHSTTCNEGHKFNQSSDNKFGEIKEKFNLENEERNSSNVEDVENQSGCDSMKNTTNKNINHSDLRNSESSHVLCSIGSTQPSPVSNMEYVNSEGNFESHHQQPIATSCLSNNSHFTSTNLMPNIAPQNISTFSSHVTPNFPMNCPLLSNSGNNIMAAVYIAAALGGNHSSVLSNPNSRCSAFRHDNLAPNSNGYHDIVSSKLWQYYITNRQTEAMYVRKVQLRNALHMVMSCVFENAGLFIVGSSMNGFGNDHSDMDLCLTITSKELHQKKEAFVVLNQLVEPLRKCSFIKNLQLIRATVPILKFRDALAGVDCDLNINNVVGIYNTHLLAMYNRIDWRVRPLGMYIKHWAQKLDLHDASRGRLSTYTLILMIIQYLQAGCQPPVLPSLQSKFHKHFSYDRQVKEVDMRLELPWDELRSTNTMRLSDLLLGFFEYYVEKFDFSRMVVSVRTGKPLPIETAIKQLPPHEQLHNVKSFKMFVEEPFSLTNVARSLFDEFVFSRIKRCFCHSLQVMRLKKSLKCIFSLPNLSNSSSFLSNSDNLDQTRSTVNPSPTSNSTQDDNSKIVPISDNIENDISEKSDFKEDGFLSDDNKSLEKNSITQCDFDDDDVSISGIIS